MRYTPDWEPLADALRRVLSTGSTGVSEDETKIDMSRAIADRKIRVRVTVAKSDPGMGGRVFPDGNVRVPPHLRPSDLNWLRSRPFKPWLIGPQLVQHYEWPGGEQDRPIDLIELSTDDVMRILCGAQTSADDYPRIQALQKHHERQFAPEVDQAKAPTSDSPRPLNVKAAKIFVADFIKREKEAGKRPALVRLEAAAKDANWRGGRQFLREEYRRILGASVMRGRPAKSPPKFAGK